VFFHFKSKRIRILLGREHDIWWYWDDIANALEISAEELLSKLSEEQITQHVCVTTIASFMSDLGISLPENIYFKMDAENFEKTRLMDSECLNYFFEIYQEPPVVSEFNKWVDSTFSKLNQMICLLQSIRNSAQKSAEVAQLIGHLALGLDESMIMSQIDHLLAVNGIVNSGTNLLKFAIGKNKILYRNHA
jgi:prophage antirepressor-like protein